MGDGSGGDRLSFLDRRVPWSFNVRVVGLEPGTLRAFDAAEWRDALVVVEHGAIELESLNGSFRRFDSGAVLWLSDLPLRAIHNRGTVAVLLLAVARRPDKRAVRAYLRPP